MQVGLPLMLLHCDELIPNEDILGHCVDASIIYVTSRRAVYVVLLHIEITFNYVLCFYYICSAKIVFTRYSETFCLHKSGFKRTMPMRARHTM